MACVRRIKELKARKIGKGNIYMENKVYFELTTKHIKYLQQIQHWNFIKYACSNTKQQVYTNIACGHNQFGIGVNGNTTDLILATLKLVRSEIG